MRIELRRGDVEHDGVDVRQCSGDLGALGRVVVGEDERIEAEPERLGYLDQLLRLAPPVGDEGGEVVELEPHPRVFLERRACCLRIVLRSDREQQSPPAEIAQVLLERRERLAVGALAHRDAPRAFLAHDPSPQRVVEVDHQAPRAETDVACEHRSGLSRE